MEKKNYILGDRAIYSLKSAALYPQRRGEMIERALQELLISLPAVGTALIWPCQDRNVPWKVYYAGINRESMQPWLAARLNFSLDATLAVLQGDLLRLADLPFPQLICLQPAPRFPAGLWIVWTVVSPLLREALGYLQEVQRTQGEIRRTLEALIEVESLEDHYFSSASPLSDPALAKALAQGDRQALSALLSMTRLVGHADFTAWGRAYQDVIEATDHIGAKQSGFGFVIPYGKGISGRIATSGTPILNIKDYRHSFYRHSSVTSIVDREQVRSIIAVPIHARREQERSEYIAGILYVSRRTVKPFSLSEQLLVQRATRLLEPLPPLTRPSSFLALGLPPVADYKVAWCQLILQANHIENLETWVDRFIKGTIIVTDGDGRPYVFARTKQLEYLRAASASSIDGVQVISLHSAGSSSAGHVYLRSAIALPPASWPDFFADLVMACNLIIGRMEQAYDYLAQEREQWLQTVLQEEALSQVSQDGYRLGLPIKEGQLWVVAWPTQGLLNRQAVGRRMLAENMVLDQLACPLLFLGDDIGVVLLNKHVEQHPSTLHEVLITQFAPDPFWVVYGARYHSLDDLKLVLTHSISLAQKARHEEYSEYLLKVQTPGLAGLLANSKLAEELRTLLQDC